MDTELTCLSSMKNLSNLTLFRCSIGEDGFKSLRVGELEHLKRLMVEEDHSGLSELSLLGSLQFLHLIHCMRAKNLPDVSHLKNLQGLRIHKCEELSEVPGLGRLESLRELSIGYCKSWKRTGLCLSVSLKELFVYSCTCHEELPNLSPLKNLEVLRIHNCKGLLAIQGLGGLESLEELYIGRCWSLKTMGPRMPVNLKRLCVDSCTCLRKLPDLSCSKKLQKLKIWSCNALVKITGLGEMESLEKLSLFLCNSLKSLGPQLPVSLQILRISSCNGLKRLPDVSHLKNLQELSTGGADVDIPGHEELKLLKTDNDFVLLAMMGE